MALYAQRAIGELFRIKHGFAFKGEHFSDAGEYIVLTPGNFEARGGLKRKGDKEKYYTGEIPDGFVLERGDLVVAMTDLTQDAPLLGAPAFVPESGRFLHNQRLGKVVDLRQDELDRRYLFYLFNLPAVRSQLKASATGATVRHTAPDRIHAVKAPVPPLSAQRRVAGILSAYDDLVENNARRIKLLEEMARSIYREWFVRFRFPGHEEVRQVGSPIGKVPEGWQPRAIGTLLASHIGGGWGRAAPDEKHTEGAYVIRGTDIPEVRWLRREAVPFRYHEPAKLRSRELVPGDLVMEVSGGGKDVGVGRVLLVDRRLLDGLSAPAMCASFCKRMTPRHDEVLPLWLWFHLDRRYESGALEQYEVRFTGIRNLNFAAFLEGERLPLPPIGLQVRFADVVAAVWRQASLLAEKNELLRRARDLLLPRLLSGEVDVSAMPLPPGA